MARIGALALLLVGSLLLGCSSSGSGGPFDRASDEKASAANARLGASYLQAGNLQQAEERLSRAIELDNDNADAHAAYALLQQRLEKPDKAAEHFERALELDPDSPRLKNNYATMLCNREEFDKAIELFVEAANDRLYETPAYAFANAGTCARDAGRDDEARGYFEQAREADPGFGRPVIALAEIAYERERAQQAADYLDQYHDMARPSARSLWLGVRIERMRGNDDGAEEYGRRLVRNYPDSSEAAEFIESRN